MSSQGKQRFATGPVVVRFWTSASPFLLACCSGSQAALDPVSEKADRIAWLFWVFTAVCVIVWVAVVLVMFAAIFRRFPGDHQANGERGTGLAVGVATGFTTLALIIFTLLSYLTTQGFGATSANALRITVTGKQWWWRIEYQGASPSESVTTANELHVPIGMPITITLISNDVIHSFWVPNIAGKQDLIPGRTNTITFTVSKPGTYRGQCAEFCGLQHAHMALLVIAESPDDFAKWRARELSDAATPADPGRAQGLEVFLRSGCVVCHSIRGTPAGGLQGPDLTHLASRQTIAAATLPNTRGNLQGWIADPQGIKPGAQMPRAELDALDLNAVSDYLSELK